MNSVAPPVLECSGLKKSFEGRLAVDGVGFRIAGGEVYGLLGPNGAGKTTTMRMVCGLLTPDAGSITIAGHQAIGNLEVKSFIGYVPQDVEHSAGISAVSYPSVSALGKGAARSEINAGVVIPAVLIAVVQSALIVLAGSLVFGVSWGNPPAAFLLLLLWCLVGAGAGMVAGTVFSTPEQASAIGPVVGIAFAMLGGCMWPLLIVSPAMRAIGHVTPQAWAVDAWTNLLSNHGTIITIWHQLGILALFALAFFAIATVRSRRLLGT